MPTPSREPRLRTLARSRKLLIGVVHLPPLPGSPGYQGASLASIIEQARADAAAFLEAGWSGYVIENFGDSPFFKERVPPHVLTLLTRIAMELPRGDASTLRGVNVLRNDALGALAVAHAAELDFVRINVHVGAMVTDQGIVEGKAATTTRWRRTFAPGVALLADVAVKHAYPLGSGFDLQSAAMETAYRGGADGLILTGRATGSPVDGSEVHAVRSAIVDRPLFVGSGVTEASVAELLWVADGAIVGTAVKKDGRVQNRVDPARARRIARNVAE